MGHHQKSLEPRTFNSLRIGFNRSFRHALPKELRRRCWQAVERELVERAGTRISVIRRINIAGFSLIGDQTQLPITRYTDTYQVMDEVSLIRGYTRRSHVKA